MNELFNILSLQFNTFSIYKVLNYYIFTCKKILHFTGRVSSYSNPNPLRLDLDVYPNPQNKNLQILIPNFALSFFFISN